MKYLIFILISLSLFSCSKSNTEPTVKELDIDKEYKKEIKLLTVNPIIDKNNIEDSEKIIEFSKIKVNNNETIIENENIFKNSTGTLEVETIIKNDNIAKSKFELINEEEYLLLTFSNIKECDKLVYIKNKCLDNFTFKLAEQSNKLGYCYKIKNKDRINICKDNILYNTLQCDKISNNQMKNDCNKIIEENKKSIEEKNNISQKINTAKENENTQVCKTINNYIDKFNCIKPIILSKLDIYLCNDIFEDKEGRQCMHDIERRYNKTILKKAYTDKNLDLCNKITKITLKNQCKEMKL